MILGRDILYELQIDLYFSDYTIRVNIRYYKGCTTPVEDVNKTYSITTTEHLKDESLRNE